MPDPSSTDPFSTNESLGQDDLTDESSPPQKQWNEEQVRQTALNIIARREHSILELQRKLTRREIPESLIETVIEDFKQRNWLNDERFAELYIRKRYFNGYGPQRITMELKERGIEHSDADLWHQPEFDWFESAKEVYCKKYMPYQARYGCHSAESECIGQSQQISGPNKQNPASQEKLSFIEKQKLRQKQLKILAKQRRFLQYRGFSYEQIDYAIESSRECEG